MGKERSMTSVITMMQVLLFSMAAAVITVMAFGIAVQNHLQVRFMDRLEVSDRITGITQCHHTCRENLAAV